MRTLAKPPIPLQDAIIASEWDHLKERAAFAPKGKRRERHVRLCRMTAELLRLDVARRSAAK